MCSQAQETTFLFPVPRLTWSIQGGPVCHPENPNSHNKDLLYPDEPITQDSITPWLDPSVGSPSCSAPLAELQGSCSVFRCHS